MKAPVLLVLLLAVAVAVAFFIFSKPSYPLTEEDAKKYFMEDLAEKYPDADVREIVEIISLNSSDGAHFYQLKARVTRGLHTPCPERLDVHYDYPPKNFIAQPPAYITKGCKICIGVEKCVLAFPEEAIIASHTYSGAESVASFIRQHSDAKPNAKFMESFRGFSDVWLVSWSSESSGKSYLVVLSKTQNKILSVEELQPA
ncbi:MAG: hypothetical protein N3F07_01475 [Candidatus Micrarchaeota archaeon]|nr:hypothetical protein [Candidatus Micrarchaeota archaeon]